MTEPQSRDLGDGITCLLAPNPSPMTGTGTNTYLLQGPDGMVIIDPGPAVPSHRAAILAALKRQPLRAILITHAHLDHTALAPDLARTTDTPLLAFGAAAEGRSEIMQSLFAQGMTGGGEGTDHAFQPDERLTDGQTLHLAGLTLEVIHTPGHMAGHLCFALGHRLFSGDHVMGWSSSIVSPPDGDMAHYMESLERLRDRTWQDFLPGHGAPVVFPERRVLDLIQHRKAREASVLKTLRLGPATAEEIARSVYKDTPAALLPAASRNVLAHLIDLSDRNLIAPLGSLSSQTRFEIRCFS